MNRQLNEKTIKYSPFGVSAYEYQGLDSHHILVAYNRSCDRFRYEKYIVTYYKNNAVALTRKISSIEKIKQFIRVIDGLAF